jgi:hypothetical protein
MRDDTPLAVDLYERRSPNTEPLVTLVARFGSWLPN